MEWSAIPSPTKYQATTYTLPGGPAGAFVGYEGLNWVEQLAALRGVDFGAFESDPAVRSDSRYDGYAQNWALKGQRALGGTLLALVSPIFAGQTLAAQVSGLATQIQSGDVDVAVLMIGGNDVVWEFLTGGSLDPGSPGFQAFQDDLVTEVIGAATVLANAGAPVVIGGLPLATDVMGPANPALAALNAALEAAVPSGMVYVDPFAEVNARSLGPGAGFPVGSERIAYGTAPSSLLVPPGDPSAVVPSQCGFAGTLIPPMPGPEGCPTQAYQRFHIQDDGIHPTTVTQGLMANALIAGINAQLHPADRILPLSDSEILTVAGLPEPGTALLLASGLAGLALRRRRN